MFLLEHIKFFLLESEERAKFILDKQGPSLYNAYQNDRGPSKPKGISDAEGVMKFLLTMDPTENKEYLQWLTNKYVKAEFSLEDHNRIKQSLEGFRAYRNILPAKMRDVNTFTAPKLTQVINSFSDLAPQIEKEFKKQFGPGGINERKAERVQKNIRNVVDMMKHLSKADTSPDKHFVLWILKEFAQGHINWFDVDGKVKSDIDTIRTKHGDKDFSKMTPEEIAHTVRGVAGKTLQWNPTVQEKKYLENKEAEILYRDNQVVIITPHTYEASRVFGEDTIWCTARHVSHYKSYTSSGPLFILYTPDGKLQFHFENRQFMNKHDVPAQLGVFIDHYPQIAKFFNHLAEKHGVLELMKNPSDKAIVSKISNEPLFLTKVAPSKLTQEMVQAAVENSTSYNVKEIMSFVNKFRPELINEKTKLATITASPNAITEFDPDKLTSEEVEAAFKERGGAFKHRLNELVQPFKWVLQNRPDLIKQDMVDRIVAVDPSIITSVKKDNITENTIKSVFSTDNDHQLVDVLDFVMKNYDQFVDDEDLKKIVVKSRHALQHIPEKRQSEEVVKAALEADPGSFQYIKNPSDEMIKVVLTTSPYMIKEAKHIAKRVTTDMLVRAAQEKPQTLIHEFALDDPSSYLPKNVDMNKVLIAAVETKPSVIKFIDKKYLTPELVETAIKKGHETNVSVAKFVDKYLEKNPSLKLKLKKDGYL